MPTELPKPYTRNHKRKRKYSGETLVGLGAPTICLGLTNRGFRMECIAKIDLNFIDFGFFFVICETVRVFFLIF